LNNLISQLEVATEAITEEDAEESVLAHRVDIAFMSNAPLTLIATGARTGKGGGGK